MKPIEQIRRENLQKAIDDLFKGSQTDAAKRLGKDRSTQINHWLGGAKNLSTPSARSIEEQFGLPEFWMDVEHNSVHVDISKRSEKSGIVRGSVSTPGMGGETKRRARQVTPPAEGERRIPVLSYMQARNMTPTTDPFSLGDSFETVETTDPECSAQSFAIDIEDSAMRPEFVEGDRVYIDPNAEPDPGDAVLAVDSEGEIVFRNYRPRGRNADGQSVYELYPLNDDYATLNSEYDRLRILGVAFQKLSNLRRRRNQ